MEGKTEEEGEVVVEGEVEADWVQEGRKDRTKCMCP